MYRAQQFFRAVGARMGLTAWAEVEALLTPPQVALFRRMPRYDQRHSLNVARTLRVVGYHHPELQVAALLHDVAKSSGPLRLWQRITIVLLRAFVPWWMAWLTRKAEPGHWRYPFYTHRMHPEIGARWAEEAGCSSLAVWLIANHQSFVDQGTSGREDNRVHLLAALRWADDQN